MRTGGHWDIWKQTVCFLWSVIVGGFWIKSSLPRNMESTNWSKRSSTKSQKIKNVMIKTNLSMVESPASLQAWSLSIDKIESQHERPFSDPGVRCSNWYHGANNATIVALICKKIHGNQLLKFTIQHKYWTNNLQMV